MNQEDKDRCLDLLVTMDDARRRQVHARVDATVAGCDSITGKRRYDTYERQFDRYVKAAAELAALIEQSAEAA